MDTAGGAEGGPAGEAEGETEAGGGGAASALTAGSRVAALNGCICAAGGAREELAGMASQLAIGVGEAGAARGAAGVGAGGGAVEGAAGGITGQRAVCAVGSNWAAGGASLDGLLAFPLARKAEIASRGGLLALAVAATACTEGAGAWGAA